MNDAAQMLESLSMDDLEALDFEAALERLGQAVQQLEAGELALEDAIRLYEQGVRLSERCSQILSAAELRVQEIGVEG